MVLAREFERLSTGDEKTTVSEPYIMALVKTDYR